METAPTKGLNHITDPDEEIERCRQTLILFYIDDPPTLATNTAIIGEHRARNDTNFSDAISGELCDHKNSFARIDFKLPEVGHRFRDAKRVIRYINTMVKEDLFVLIATSVNII